MSHDDEKRICVFCQKPIRRFNDWSFGSDDEHDADFVGFDKLGFVCYSHRTCHTLMQESIIKEIADRLHNAEYDSAEHDNALELWERAVAKIIHITRAIHKGVSSRKIAKDFNVSRHFVRKVLKCLKHL